MRKKIFLFLSTIICATLVFSCRYDDTELWKSFEEVYSRIEKLEAAANSMNSDLSALQTIVNAMKKNVTVTEVVTTGDGYLIKFSDGTTATIANGKDGKDGTNAPVISLKRDADGRLYWTMDGDFLLIDGEKVCAEGIDGADGADGANGADGITPQIRINERTKEWEISIDNGVEWASTGIIAQGKDGADGKDAVAPQVRINEETKEWEVSIDGGKTWNSTGIVAQGKNGADAIAPQIRINEKTKEWEVSVDGGKKWTSTGIVAQGKDGKDGKDSSASSLFSSVETFYEDFVRFVLKDGTSFNVARYKNDAPRINIYGLSSIETFGYGESRSYYIYSSNVDDFSISKPNGWLVSMDEYELTIQAPSASNIYAETDGYVAINLVSYSGKGFIFKIRVSVQGSSEPSTPEGPTDSQMRYLTFEDADFKATPYTLSYAGNSKTISKWSDLIDDPQYGGWLLYGDSMSECGYYWYDQNNTELMAKNPENFGGTCYWSGGHAISNYVDKDLSHGDFDHQLSIYGTSGHNGSKNFCVHYGYRDNSGYSAQNLPSFFFANGKARVVDHMYVTNTTYAMNCYLNGNGLTAEIGPNDWVKLVAIGFDANGNESGTVEMYLVNGPNNIVKDWTKWDLSSLGKVTRIEFNVTGSSDNGYGFSHPAYFAYDDVAVVFE